MHPDAEIRLPAESAYVAVLRMATAGIAARLDFTIEDIEDLKMAIGEACALALTQARAGGDLRAAYRLGDGRIEIRVSVDADDPVEPDPDGFAWQVLRTAATSAHAHAAPEELSISMTLDATARTAV